MPAFSEKRELALLETVKTLANRAINLTLAPAVTHQHLLEMFVKPEDHDAVIKARKLFKHETGGCFATTVTLPGNADASSLTVQVNSLEAKGSKPFMHPYYMGKKLCVDGEHEGYKLMVDYVEKRLRVGYAWGEVYAVVGELNQRCETTSQVRFFWPGIATLAGMTEGLEKLADSVRKANTPPVIPNIPPELRRACRDTTRLLTMATLLPKNKNERDTEPVEFLITARPYLRRPWGGSVAMPWL